MATAQKISGLSRARTITLLVALATLTSNTLSAIFFAQISDDPYYLANPFGWYLHFANVGSVFGIIGALRQHPLSIEIFSFYLLLDTVLCLVPRFVLVSMLHPVSSHLCTPPFSPSQSQSQLTQQAPGNQASERIDESVERCYTLVQIAQIALMVGVLVATMLQFSGALCVRSYAKALGEIEAGAEAEVDVEDGVDVNMDTKCKEQKLVDV